MEKFSYSKISLFQNCPFSYYNNYYLKTQREEHGTSQFGNFVHDILEKYGKNQIKINDIPLYYIKNYDDYVKDNLFLELAPDFKKSFMKNFAEDYFNKGFDYLKNFKGFQNLEILEVEHNFNIQINDFIFTGKIDLICKDENGDIVLIDHKSKGKFKNIKEQNDYAKQLYCYVYPIREKYGVFPKKICFNMIKLQQMIEIDFDVEEYNRVIDWLKDSVKKIQETKEYPATPHDCVFFCRNFCGYRNANMEKCRLAIDEK